jgi:hypothetical protein
MGKWFISQGHDGRYTHQSDWRHAWDFVKIGQDTKPGKITGISWTTITPGQNRCTRLPWYRDSVTDGIPDNPPGDANTLNNWGNTVVMWHAAGLYTKYSHLKSGSIRFKPAIMSPPIKSWPRSGTPADLRTSPAFPVPGYAVHPFSYSRLPLWILPPG